MHRRPNCPIHRLQPLWDKWLGGIVLFIRVHGLANARCVWRLPSARAYRGKLCMKVQPLILRRPALPNTRQRQLSAHP